MPIAWFRGAAEQGFRADTRLAPSRRQHLDGTLRPLFADRRCSASRANNFRSANSCPRLGAECNCVTGIACSADAETQLATLEEPARGDPTLALRRPERDRDDGAGQGVSTGARTPRGTRRSDSEVTISHREGEDVFPPGQ